MELCYFSADGVDKQTGSVLQRYSSRGSSYGEEQACRHIQHVGLRLTQGTVTTSCVPRKGHSELNKKEQRWFEVRLRGVGCSQASSQDSQLWVLGNRRRRWRWRSGQAAKKREIGHFLDMRL